MQIVCDAGHGGRDPGAVGNNLLEKDITLGVALALGVILTERGHEVIQTRTADEFVTLAARQATGKTADAFVSIHANAFNTQARGIESWFDSGDETSERLAISLQRHMCLQFPMLYNRGVKEGSPERFTDWYTFDSGGSDVLVELGFIDHAGDSTYLTPEHWQEWALALADGLEDHLGAQPAPIKEDKDEGGMGSEYERMLFYEATVQNLFDKILPHQSALPESARKALRRVEVDFAQIRGHISIEERDRLIADEQL